MPNTSLDASGGCVFFKFFRAFIVDRRPVAASTQSLDRFPNKMDRKFLIALILAVIGPILTLIFVRPIAPLILIFPFASLLILVFPTMAGFYSVALIQFLAYVFVWNIARKMKRPQNPGVFHVVVALVSLVIVASLLGQ